MREPAGPRARAGSGIAAVQAGDPSGQETPIYLQNKLEMDWKTSQSSANRLSCLEQKCAIDRSVSTLFCSSS